jgi:hypothetical protein
MENRSSTLKGKYCRVGICLARFFIEEENEAGTHLLLRQIDRIPDSMDTWIHLGWFPVDRCEILNEYQAARNPYP